MFQLFNIHTGGLLAEIHTGHHSTIQYCDFSPSNHLAVVALSQYCVEVSSWICSVNSGSPEGQRWPRMGCLDRWLLKLFVWEMIECFLHGTVTCSFKTLSHIDSFFVCLFVWLCPFHVEVPGPGIELALQLQPAPQLELCWILKLLRHKGISKAVFSFWQL